MSASRNKDFGSKRDIPDAYDVPKLVPEDVPDVWTPGLVADALVFAIRAAARIAGRTGPRGYGNNMPPVLHGWEDIVNWVNEAGEFTGTTRAARVGFSAEEITRIEDALGWQATYLVPATGRRGAGIVRVFRVWLACRAARVPFGKACSRRGWSRRTAYNRRDKALSIISIGLDADGVPVWCAEKDQDGDE